MSLSTHCTLQAVLNTHLAPLIPAFPRVERGSRLEQHPRTDKRGQGREGRRARHPSESTDQVLIRCRDAITHPGAVPAPQSGWTRGLGTFGYIHENTRLSCPRTGDKGHPPCRTTPGQRAGQPRRSSTGIYCSVSSTVGRIKGQSANPVPSPSTKC